jgi:hypothetical protein
MTETAKCKFCCKEDEIGHVVGLETGDTRCGILYIDNFETSKREATCPECHKKLAREGKTQCPHWYSHHIGTTCTTCKVTG